MADISVEKLSRVYIKIRDKKSEIKAAHDAEYKALTEQQAIVTSALLEFCKDKEVDSVKTSAGTVSRSVKSRYWTSDWESMYGFILENKLPEFLNKALNQKNIREFLEDHPDTILPGLNVDSEYAISVTKPRNK